MNKIRLVLLVALCGCNQKLLTRDAAQSCLTANPSKLARVNPPEGTPVAAGDRVTWQLSVAPECAGQYQLITPDSEPFAFSNVAYFERTYGAEGEMAESVKVRAVSASSQDPGTEVSLKLGVTAPPPFSTTEPLSCSLLAAPPVVLVPVDASGRLLVKPTIRLAVISRTPVRITNIIGLPSPDVISLAAGEPLSLPTAPIVQFSVGVNRLFQSLIGVYVADAANRVASCYTTVRLQPAQINAPPPPTVAILANGQPISVVSVATGQNVISWSSANADRCLVTPGNFPALVGEEKVALVTSAKVSYSITCQGLGGTATASVEVLANCDANPPVDYPGLGIKARHIPRRLASGSYPPGVFTSSPNINDIRLNTPLVSGLKPGQRITSSDLAGNILWRVRHSGAVEGKSLCVEANVVLQFTDDAGKLIEHPSYPLASGAMVPLRSFSGAGITVPAGATQVWGSYPDSGYWDNEDPDSNFGSDRPRVPSSGSTDGCHFGLHVYGCR